MIANSLIIPTERPPRLMDVKRALLSYDKVYMPSSNDRELIPPNAYAAASSPFGFFPLAFSVGQVRPLGKVKDYDSTFDKVISELKDASAQESFVVLEAPQYNETLTIGAVPMPENTPNPVFVYQAYRQMSANPDFIMAVSRGLDELGSISMSDVDEIAPSGADDNQMQFYLNGEPTSSLPAQALYNGFVSNEEERVFLTKLCLARLGSTVKYLSVCHLQELHPYTSDPGIASVVQLLNHNTASVYEKYWERDDLLEQQKRLNQLHGLMMSEFVKLEMLEELSVKEILKLRTKAWGKSREARSKLEKQLRVMALENPTPESFQNACRQAIKDYQKEQADWLHEVKKFGVKILSGLGILATVPSGSQIIQKLFSTPSIETVLVIGGAAFFTFTEKYSPELLDILKERKDIQASAGYALFRPYSYLV